MQKLAFRRLQSDSPVIFGILVAAPASALVWAILVLVVQTIFTL